MCQLIASAPVAALFGVLGLTQLLAFGMRATLHVAAAGGPGVGGGHGVFAAAEAA